MQTPKQALDHDFLEARCMLVEVAAALDRYDRAVEKHGTERDDERLEKIYQSLSLLAARNAAPNRAERLLQLFSDPA